jgi:hypothetical protein
LYKSFFRRKALGMKHFTSIIWPLVNFRGNFFKSLHFRSFWFYWHRSHVSMMSGAEPISGHTNNKQTFFGYYIIQRVIKVYLPPLKERIQQCKSARSLLLLWIIVETLLLIWNMQWSNYLKTCRRYCHRELDMIRRLSKDIRSCTLE